MRTEGLSEQQQDGVWAGFRAGESLSGVARHQGTRLQNVQRFLAQTGGIRPVPQRRSGRQLSAGTERRSPAAWPRVPRSG